MKIAPTTEDLLKDYGCLEVETNALPGQIKEAYRFLARVWHPDRFVGGDTKLRAKAEERMKAINAAYDRIQSAPLLGVAKPAPTPGPIPGGGYSGGYGQQAGRTRILMPFGKYKGEYIDEIPSQYLNWCLDNIDNLRYTLRTEMQDVLLERDE